MLSDGEPNLTDTAADSSADATPHSPRPAAPRRAVPTTFNPIINDEANILAAITRGDRTIFDLAEEHGTTVANFAVWLQREDIQQKLSDLTSAGTTLTRVAAVNQLPKAVKAMAFQIEAHIFDRTHNLIKPGLAADKISALRDANARKACNLLLRLAKFYPSLPLYRAPRLLPRQGEVSPKASEGAPALSTASPSAPSSDLPDLLSLCAAALSAAHNAHDSRTSANTEPETRDPDPDSSADPCLDLALSLASQDLAHTNGNGRHHNGDRNGKHNGHTNGRRIRHTRPPDSPPKSRPPPH